MKKILTYFIVSAGICLAAATASYAQTSVATTIASNYLSLNGQTYSLSGPASIVDQSGYVRIDLPGGNMINSQTNAATAFSFSLLIPKSDWYSLLF